MNTDTGNIKPPKTDDFTIGLERIYIKMRLKRRKVEIPQEILYDIDALRKLDKETYDKTKHDGLSTLQDALNYEN